MKALTGTYAAPKLRPQLIEVPKTSFLMIDGRGSPNKSDYMDAIQALYAVAYGTKFALKQTTGFDFRVMPLETLWWSDSGTFSIDEKDTWSWTAMISVPDAVTASVVKIEVARAAAKRSLPALSKLHLGTLDEGLCAQVLNVGPYDEEAETIEALHKFIADSGYSPHGKHHEIYLSDPRRTVPARIRTIIRQPVTR